MITFFCLFTFANAASIQQSHQQEFENDFLASWQRHDRKSIEDGTASFDQVNGKTQRRNILPNIRQNITITYLDDDFTPKPDLKAIMKERKFRKPKGGYLLLSIGDNAWNNYLTFPTSFRDFSRLYYHMKHRLKADIRQSGVGDSIMDAIIYDEPFDKHDAEGQTQELLAGFPSNMLHNLFVPVLSKSTKQARALQIQNWLKEMISKPSTADIAIRCLIGLLNGVRRRNKNVETFPPLFLQSNFRYFVRY